MQSIARTSSVEIIDLKENFKRSRCRWRNNDDRGTIAAADAAAPLETSMPDKEDLPRQIIELSTLASMRARLDDSIGFKKAWNGPRNKYFWLSLCLRFRILLVSRVRTTRPVAFFDRPRR